MHSSHACSREILSALCRQLDGSPGQLARSAGAIDKLLRDRGCVDIAVYIGVQHVIAAVELPCRSTQRLSNWQLTYPLRADSSSDEPALSRSGAAQTRPEASRSEQRSGQPITAEHARGCTVKGRALCLSALEGLV